MVIRLHKEDLTDMIFERKYPPNYSTAKDYLNESILEFNYSIGKAKYQEIYFDGIHIGYGDAILTNQISLCFETDAESVEMHFALLGSNTAFTDTFGKAVTFETSQQNIIYANSMRGKMIWETKVFKVFEINLKPSLFKKYLPDDDFTFKHFLKSIEHGRSGLLYSTHRAITYQMHQLIMEIMSCQRQGIFKKMFLESKIIELLLLQFEQFYEKEPYSTSLKKSEVEKIYAIKEFLSCNTREQHSLIQLAHKFGTNEFALKKGFRELFGTTVFGYWNDIKMNEAKRMLLEGEKSVSEISQIIGYKHPRHFSTAFKRMFGIMPSGLNKLK